MASKIDVTKPESVIEQGYGTGNDKAYSQAYSNATAFTHAEEGSGSTFGKTNFYTEEGYRAVPKVPAASLDSGKVDTVNNIPPTAGTKNVPLTGEDIPVSGAAGAGTINEVKQDKTPLPNDDKLYFGKNGGWEEAKALSLATEYFEKLNQNGNRYSVYGYKTLNTVTLHIQLNSEMNWNDYNNILDSSNPLPESWRPAQDLDVAAALYENGSGSGVSAIIVPRFRIYTTGTIQKLTDAGNTTMKHWVSRFVVTYQVANTSAINLLDLDENKILAAVPFVVSVPAIASASQSAATSNTLTVPAETTDIIVQLKTNRGWGDSLIKSESIIKNNDTSWNINFNVWKTASGASPAYNLDYIAYCIGKKEGAYILKKPKVSKKGGSTSGGGSRTDGHTIPVGSYILGVYGSKDNSSGGNQPTIIGNSIDATTGKTTSGTINVEIWNEGSTTTNCYSYISYIEP